MAFFSERFDYGEHYLTDMLDAFKYVDTDFATKSPEPWCNAYCASYGDKYRTVFSAAQYASVAEIGAEGGGSGFRVSMAECVEARGTQRAAPAAKAQKTKYLITAIVPTRRGDGRLLEGRLFRSLQRSALFHRLEILLMRVGAPDAETRAIMERLGGQYPNVRICSPDGAGEAGGSDTRKWSGRFDLPDGSGVPGGPCIPGGPEFSGGNGGPGKSGVPGGPCIPGGPEFSGGNGGPGRTGVPDGSGEPDGSGGHGASREETAEAYGFSVASAAYGIVLEPCMEVVNDGLLRLYEAMRGGNCDAAIANSNLAPFSPTIWRPAEELIKSGHIDIALSDMLIKTDLAGRHDSQGSAGGAGRHAGERGARAGCVPAPIGAAGRIGAHASVDIPPHTASAATRMSEPSRAGAGAAYAAGYSLAISALLRCGRASIVRGRTYVSFSAAAERRADTGECGGYGEFGKYSECSTYGEFGKYSECSKYGERGGYGERALAAGWSDLDAAAGIGELAAAAGGGVPPRQGGASRASAVARNGEFASAADYAGAHATGPAAGAAPAALAMLRKLGTLRELLPQRPRCGGRAEARIDGHAADAVLQCVRGIACGRLAPSIGELREIAKYVAEHRRRLQLEAERESSCESAREELRECLFGFDAGDFDYLSSIGAVKARAASAHGAAGEARERDDGGDGHRQAARLAETRARPGRRPKTPNKIRRLSAKLSDAKEAVQASFELDRLAYRARDASVKTSAAYRLALWRSRQRTGGVPAGCLALLALAETSGLDDSNLNGVLRLRERIYRQQGNFAAAGRVCAIRARRFGAELAPPGATRAKIALAAAKAPEL
ncbi:MAG: hypothetical protein LBJ10_07395, partial [Clostridiales bacterium]|nr:hypothetical protein [Clostridiales bacterium]